MVNGAAPPSIHGGLLAQSLRNWTSRGVLLGKNAHHNQLLSRVARETMVNGLSEMRVAPGELAQAFRTYAEVSGLHCQRHGGRGRSTGHVGEFTDVGVAKPTATTSKAPRSLLGEPFVFLAAGIT